MPEAELLADVHNTIGESPVWLDASDAVYWVDAEDHVVYWRSDRDGRLEQRSLSVPATALIPRAGGGWILVAKDGLYAADEDFTTATLIVDPSAGDQETRLNDGIADRRGRVWTGSMSRSDVTQPIGRLYIVSSPTDVVEVDDGFAVANGIAMSPDGDRAYVSDQWHGRIRVYELDRDSGDIAARLSDIDPAGPGYPDGLAVDREGLIWVAYWDGGRVDRMDADGTLVASLSLPVDQVTRACLGGATGSRLYVTTGRYALGPAQLQEQPHAGALFSAEVDGVGLPPAEARL